MCEKEINDWLNKDRSKNKRFRGGLDNNPGWYSGLYDMIKVIEDHQIMTMVELGTYMGESTELFALTFKEIITIDPRIGKLDWDNELEEIFKKTVLDVYPNVSFIKGFSVNEAKRFADNSLDFVYIDADHSYQSVHDDILAWLPKIKKSGYIGGHDYQEYFRETVIRAVNEILGEPHFIFSDNSWLFKIKELSSD